MDPRRHAPRSGYKAQTAGRPAWISDLIGSGRVNVDARRDDEAWRPPMDIEAVVPNEIIAMILSACDPADVPAVRGVCARWRDLAPDPEPDLVLAVQDDRFSAALYAVPRARVATPFLDRLKLDSSRAVDDDTNDDDDFYTMMDMCSDTISRGSEITLRCLFANLQQCNRRVQLFAVDFDEDDLCYKVTQFKTKHELAAKLVYWARSTLDMEEEYPRSFTMPDIDTDEGLAVASALFEKAQKAWL
ncbi:F-box domain containing protein [Pandoravirus salinus]|uniref:F-box domain containing protein n=1 Tax=Pandoravirus salinus TaxID=1349410 RepID=S4W3B3_9VIRU|nr:F-box domain [Pandoravirus salinus]AGO84740.1 F-box domain containing protein [Pandoravirus salinus]